MQACTRVKGNRDTLVKGPGIHMSRVLEIQKSRKPGIQESRGLEIHESSGTGIQESRVLEIQKSKGNQGYRSQGN